jgi:RNA polymerase sigma factor for flagellar operon FliA
MNTTLEQVKANGEFLVKEYIKTRQPSIKEKIVQAYSPLVKYIVGRINFPSTAILAKEDLYQCGIIGLLSALERYQPDSKAAFKTFAYKRIHGEVIDAIRRAGLVGRDKYDQIKAIEKATNDLTGRLGREPAAEEVCHELSITEDEYHERMNASLMNYMLSLDTKINDDNGDFIYRVDTVEDDSQMNPEETVNDINLKKLVQDIMPTLPERERLILALYFYEELTLYDIGQVLGLTESRVSQILNKTLVEIKVKIS